MKRSDLPVVAEFPKFLTENVLRIKTESQKVEASQAKNRVLE